MKSGIHPKYHDKVTAKCACGAEFLVGSTDDEIGVEICSACHPFFTGKQKLVDTAGRVDKFRARMAAKETAKAAELTRSKEKKPVKMEKEPQTAEK